ncbi:LytTR family DNA-binding domain-containing protein [Allobaculum stercoricanis]|uniref:LytTR family DNA-binding domain-containing protein n=1 Tax=Allobaculum stercoricanis TaxID=174709 RepID=UPI00037ED077|nr:LytTR family DNA-binding domain-containing protein [Allobaculum stercoricanis]
MVKIAILEHEKETKEIVFQLAGFFNNIDWTFRHFYKASLLAKAMKEEEYQIFFFDEMFQTPRLESVFVHDNPSALFVYLCQDPAHKQATEHRRRVLYISKYNLKQDMIYIESQLKEQMRQKECYPLSFQGVKIDIPIEDIYYLEKVGKFVHFHTRKGEFHGRLYLADLEEEFAKYGFMRVHISYLVNSKYLTGIYKDEVELNHSMRVPLSRAQKKKLGLKVRKVEGATNTPLKMNRVMYKQSDSLIEQSDDDE